jgi:hypothetical protein
VHQKVLKGLIGKAEQAIDQTHAPVAAISRGLGNDITPDLSMNNGKKYTVMFVTRLEFSVPPFSMAWSQEGTQACCGERDS